MVARRRRHGPAHDPARSDQSQPHLHRHLGRRRFRTDDGGKTWKPINRGLKSQYIPDPNAEVGHCVHRIAMHPSRPNMLFMQKHWDVMRSDDAGDNWHEVSGNLPTDFGFPIDVHAHEPDTVYVVPITSDSLALPARRQAPRLPQPHRRQRVGTAHQRPAAERTATSTSCATRCPSTRSTRAASTSAPPAGRCICSPDGGDNWTPIVRDLPAVVSVEVQTLP